ncbi:MAG: TIR domain-containing protein [Clostridia bacterium]|nr:TIR domain-containing protein [Clostridia bacterium]
MAVLKCKMCGGDLDFIEGASTAECEYCGTLQTIPKADDEKKLTFFARANRLRAACEFDKAAGIYESIVADFPEEAEAYWGLVLCKFGIEYVDDPATGKKIPTCHRSSFDSVMDDGDFDQALENADAVARKVYREEAKAIEEIRKGIISVSANEEPYDIFICYKETDENGERTLDSVLAQDVYEALGDKGYRVFFSRITLEDKLGVEYEPYIFAALNSAKIMLAFGTDYEYYNAVWVKNEWSRYLKLMAKDKEKHLIPCFKGIDAYDMPKEFAKLQAQDMGKVGAIQDLLRGIEKLLPLKKTSSNDVINIGQTAISNTAPLLERGFIFLEDKEWERADMFFEQVLNLEPKNALAYLGKLMLEMKVTGRKELGELNVIFEDNNNYRKIIRFGDDDTINELKGYIVAIKDRLDMDRLAREKREEEERIALAKKEEEKRRAIEELMKNLKPFREKCAKAGEYIHLSKNDALGIMLDGRVLSARGNDSEQQAISEWREVKTLSAGAHHTVALTVYGKVFASGDNKYGQCNVSDWRNIVAVCAADEHTVGLCADGTVVAVGKNDMGKCDVSWWRDIVAIAVSKDYTFGLCSDGTVLVAGLSYSWNCHVSRWSKVTRIVAGKNNLVGICSDGTVLATGNNDYKQCDVDQWRNVCDVSVGDSFIIGLCDNGTVLAAGDNTYLQCDVKNWNTVIAVTTGERHAIGLCADGTVVTSGDRTYGQCNVGRAKNVVAVKAMGYKTMLLCADGTVIVAGDDRLSVSKWKLFENFDTIEQDRSKKSEILTEFDRIRTQRRLAEVCQHCGGTFKGLFTKKCSDCGRPKDY